MKKILLILGVLLTLANNASSSGASQPIPPESDNIIPSPQKGKNGSEVLDSTLNPKALDDSPVLPFHQHVQQWYWANSTLNPKALDDSPEWYWAYDKPLIKAPKNDEVLNIMFGLNILKPEWYWASGRPVLLSMFGLNTLDDLPEWYWAYEKSLIKAPKNDEVLNIMFGLNILKPEWYWASGRPVLLSMFGPEIREFEWYWANGKPAFDYMLGLITLDDLPPEWYWAYGKPLTKAPIDSELLDIMFGPNSLDPEWYWGYGKPLTKAPIDSELLDIMFGPNSLDPEWYWANGKPFGEDESKFLCCDFDPNLLDDSPDWYWANDKPVLDSMFDPNKKDGPAEWYWANGQPAIKAPKKDEFWGIRFGPNILEPEWYWANDKPVLDSIPNILEDSPEWYWADGKPIIKAPKNSEFPDIMFGQITLEPEWYWANGKPVLDSMFDPSTLDDSPEWYWAYGKPVKKAPKNSVVSDTMFGLNPLGDSPEWYWAYGKPVIEPIKDEVFIIADHVRHDLKKEIIWTWGKVKIRMENQNIQADKIKIKNETGEGEARGNVIIESIDGTKLKSIFSRFNIKSEKAKVFKTRGRLGKMYYVKGRELSRLSEKHYQAKFASLTTCTGKLPLWLVEAEWMDLKNGDRAFFTDGVLKVRDIPILYIPVGYLPLNQERKTGFLAPLSGYNNINGIKFDNEFFWAINDHSDATFRLGYQGKRGFNPEIQYRYTPTLKTNGMFSGKILDDNLTHETFWKVDATLDSEDLPNGWIFNGILDLEGKEYNKTFTDDTNLRNRRISNSFATIRKSWQNNSFEVLTRYRQSVDRNNDMTHGELPQITYKTQRHEIGDSGFFFNQDTLFTSFLTDLNPDTSIDRYFSVQRLDLHPQLTRSINIAPWLNFASTIGLRETLYSKGQNNTGFFSREGIDFNANIKGPTFEKVFHTRNKLTPKIKHLLEPRIAFDYVPELDVNDKYKIHPYLPDLMPARSLLSYSLIQRILTKEKNDKGDFDIREALRFMISQSYDLREAERVGTDDEPSLPFSDLRFDLDSRLVDSLLLNADTTYDWHNDVFKYWNFQIGFRPIKEFTAYLERRWNRRADVSTVATLDWDFQKYWNLKASTRLDELTDTHRENNLSLMYDDPCKCWGFNIDYINRNNFNSTANAGGTKESRWIFSFTFRGLGSVESRSRQNERFLHRSFTPINRTGEFISEPIR